MTELTVYRWELPDGARESRRPRGKVLEALRREFPEASVSPGPVSSTLDPEEHALVLPLQELFLRAEWKRCEEQLLALLVGDRLRSEGARALVAALFSLVQVVGRSDVRSAFSTLRPALVEAEAGRLPPEVEVWVRAAAAQVFAQLDGQLYDLGRVSAHLAAVERLASPREASEVRYLSFYALCCAAVHAWRSDLMPRLLEQMEAGAPAESGPLCRLLGDELRGFAALFTGRTAQARERFRACADHAAALGLHALEVLTRCAADWVSLDDGTDPALELELTRRLRGVATQARLGLGMHTLFLAMHEGEALLRLGRMEEAARVLAQGEAHAAEMKWDPAMVMHGQVRALVHSGQWEALHALAERLFARHGEEPSPLLRATACRARGLAELLMGGDLEQAQRDLDEALRLANEGAMIPMAVRGILAAGAHARLLVGEPEAVEEAVRNGEAYLERFPSAWDQAVLRRCEGLLRYRQGRWDDATRALESALGTFTLTHDVAETAITRHCLAWVQAQRSNGRDAEALDASVAELKRLGIQRLPLERLHRSARKTATGRPSASPLGALVVAMDRLSVRGVGPEQLERELLTLTEKLLPGRHVKLVAAGEPSRGEVFELGDGFGRRLKLCVGGAELNEETRDLLRALVRVGSQALELAVLRGNGPSGPSAEPGSTEGAEALGLVAASPQMRALASDLKRLTAARATVIIQGESGTGKEVVAEALHRLSSRAQGPYVPFNCAAVPRELFEGQLFGYRKGAFTGATADHPGVIRAAHGGTLFLDEIAELPLELQPKLLRFLENREVATLGDKRPQVVDVRVIAATHRDLEQAVRAGTFRQDLYYRLQVVALRIPPLRDRPEDIVALARHFVRAMTPEGNDPPALSPDGIAALLAHPWPGNARELRNVIERTLAFSPVPPVLNAQRFALAPVGR